jgi:hypothetical protein
MSTVEADSYADRLVAATEPTIKSLDDGLRQLTVLQVLPGALLRAVLTPDQHRTLTMKGRIPTCYSDTTRVGLRAGAMWDATFAMGLLYEVYHAIIGGLRLVTITAIIAALAGNNPVAHIGNMTMMGRGSPSMAGWVETGRQSEAPTLCCNRSAGSSATSTATPFVVGHAVPVGYRLAA